MSQSPHIFDVTTTSFTQEVIERSFHVPVLADFWAGWCNPCKMLAPILSGIVEHYDGQVVLAKIDSDIERDLSAHYGVRSLPTVKIFKHGEVVDEFTGVIPEPEIREIIERHLVRESDLAYADAKKALDEGDFANAEPLMQKALDLDPEHKTILLGMTEIQLRLGDAKAAAASLDKIPFNYQTDDDVEQLRSKLFFATAMDADSNLENLIEKIESHPKDCDALYQLGAFYAVQGEFEQALETFLQLIKVDKTYNEGLPRKAMLAVFNILGGSGPLVNLYRSKMASALL